MTRPTLAVLLALSLAANAALLLPRALKPNTASTAPAAQRPADAPREASAHASPAELASEPPDAALLSEAITQRDLATVRAQLLALGMPADTVRGILRTMLWQPYRERQRALLSAKNAPDYPYWHDTVKGSRTPTAAERLELRDLAASLRQQESSLLGASDATNDNFAARLAFLPPEKAAQLHNLYRDYGDLHDELNDEVSLFRLPSDGATLRLLKEQRRQDLETLLTPQELAEYDLRYSPTAANLRQRFAALPDTSEAEYRAAFQIAQDLADSTTAYTRDNLHDLSPDDRALALAQRDALQDAAATQLKALLGEDAYATYVRANDSDYQSLQGAAARFNLPANTIDHVYDLRYQAATLSQQIAADTSLSPKDKQDALKALAGQISSDVRNALGNQVGAAYLDKNMAWLKRLSKGNTLTISPAGKISTQPATQPASKPKP